MTSFCAELSENCHSALNYLAWVIQDEFGESRIPSLHILKGLDEPGFLRPLGGEVGNFVCTGFLKEGTPSSSRIMNLKHTTSSTQGNGIDTPSPINLVEDKVQTPLFPLESEAYDTDPEGRRDFQWRVLQLDFLPF